MAISYVGSAHADATTVTLPTHQTGDTFIMLASGGSAIPSLPSGWTSIHTTAVYNVRAAYKVAQSSSETSGTWTNAAYLTVSAYRGGAAADPIGGFDFNDGASTPIAFGGVTMQVTDGTSWVFAYADTESGIGTNTPSGMTQRWADTYSKMWDTNGGVSSFTVREIAAPDGGWLAYAIEILASTVQSETVSPSITSEGTLSATVTAGTPVDAAITSSGELTATLTDIKTSVPADMSGAGVLGATAIKRAPAQVEVTTGARELGDILIGSHLALARVVLDDGTVLPIVSGSLSIDSAAEVRRTASVVVAGLPEWVPTTALSVLDPRAKTEMRLDIGVVDDYGVEQWWPQGVFHCDTTPVAESNSNGLSIALELSDRAAWVKAAGMRERLVVDTDSTIVQGILSLLGLRAPWLPVEIDDDGRQAGFDMCLGEPGADPWTIAYGLCRDLGRDLHVAVDGTARAPLVTDPLSSPIVAEWVEVDTEEGVTASNLVALQLDSGDGDIVNALGCPWQEPPPDPQPEGWVADGGVEWAEDHSSTTSIEAVGERARKYDGDTSVIGSAGHAMDVAVANLVMRQGWATIVTGTVLTDPRRDVTEVVHVKRSLLGLDDILRITSLDYELLSPTMSVTFGAGRRS